MSHRAPLVISIAALTIALVGSTSIGRAGAASLVKAVPYAKTAGFAKLADNSAKLNGRKSSVAGTPGTIPVVGASGKLPPSIGAVGPKGDKGDKGDPGKIGPSNAYYAHGQTITGLPAGDYVVYAQLVDHNTTANAGTVSISAGLLGGSNGTATIAPGQASFGAGEYVTIPIEGVAHLTNTGGFGANTSTFGTFDIYWTATKVGAATP